MSRVKGMNLSKDDRKRFILDAALKTFCEIGYDASNIEDIARRANCSHGLIYYYFKNKQEIFAELLETAKHKVAEFAVNFKTDEGMEAVDILKKYTATLFDLLEHDDTIAYYFRFISMIDVLKKDCEVYGDIPQYLVYRAIKKVFDDGMSQGAFKEGDSAVFANLYLAIIAGLTLRKTQRPDDNKRVPFPDADFIVNIFLRREDRC